MGKRALFRGKGALFGVVHTKTLGHYFEVAQFEVALFEVLLYKCFETVAAKAREATLL